MSFLLQFLVPLIIPFITLAFLFGCVAAIYSILGICNEIKVLNKVKDENARIEDLKVASLRIPFLDFEMYPGHLKKRSEAIEKRVQEAEKKGGDDYVPILPQLGDLHELSLHRESHRSSTTALTTVVSVLLITGICGTMFNVHNALPSHEVSTGKLSETLEPAMWAVSFTIILLIFKGIYASMVEYYMSILDMYSLNVLLPREYKKIGKKIFNSKYEEINNTLKNEQEIINNFSDGAKDELDRAKKLVEGFKNTANVASWVAFDFKKYNGESVSCVDIPIKPTPPKVVCSCRNLCDFFHCFPQHQSSSFFDQ